MFTSNRSSSGNAEIYSMNIDGSAQTKISNHDFKLYSPAVSPDGSKIAYVGEIGSGYDIYVMNIDGSNPKKLTSDNQSSWPAWSPDGSKIAYAKSQEIWTMNADGSNQDKLNVNMSSGIYGLGSPCWSPDGSKISVTGFFSSSSNIYAINLTAMTMTQITFNTGMNVGAAWSPDGSKLVFCSDMSSNPLETGFKVYSTTASGFNLTPLTTNFTSRHTAKYSWSADGKKILFSEARPGDGNYIQIYMMNSDGSSAVRLTDPSAKDNDSPCFVPQAK
ncbi:MAG TPA: DUF5050 domain-containing protein [Candidatus Wallbacteria bacterium]|nr:DUF5050 domain-containing protein [Candidatus Wallbacteria bacterium]